MAFVPPLSHLLSRFPNRAKALKARAFSDVVPSLSQHCPTCCPMFWVLCPTVPRPRGWDGGTVLKTSVIDGSGNRPFCQDPLVKAARGGLADAEFFGSVSHADAVSEQATRSRK